MKNRYDQLSVDEAIGAAASHEAEHAADEENISLLEKYVESEGQTEKLHEKIPYEIEIQFIREVIEKRSSQD